MNEFDWIAKAAQLRTQGRSFAMVVVLHALSPTSSKPGDKALVEADGTIHGWIGGGCAQPVVQRTVVRCLADGRARTVRLSPSAEAQERDLGDILEFGMACHSGGTLELFIDPILPAPMLAVIGNTPMARTLAILAPHLGFRVARVGQGLRDEDDCSIAVEDDDAAHVRRALPQCDFVVVATQGQRDMQGLRAALALASRRVWFVASERKAGVLRQNLIAAGAEPRQVDAIIAPAGVPIGAQTPQEIALSVLAAVVAARRDSSGPEAGQVPTCAETAAPAAHREEAVLDGHPDVSAPAQAVADAPPASCCCSH